MVELVSSEQQRKFGQDKHDTLPRYCRQCEVRFARNGGCPKDRFINTPDGEPGLNYLCAGYKMFFKHVDRPMRMMAGLLRQGRYADEVMQILAAEEAAKLQQAFAASRRNDPVPAAADASSNVAMARLACSQGVKPRLTDVNRHSRIAERSLTMANQTDKHQRDILPIPDRPHTGLITYDAKDPDTKFPPIEPLRPPQGAPNVLIILLDDVGFGASSAFGGAVHRPTAERLAAGGLKYNRFHTTALCSPTRQALLTGRNHHSVGMGGITEIATSAPGYTSIRPKSAAPLAEVLKLNGYSTAQFGKCHEVPVWETSPMGPFDAWPTGGGGFEHFYGFTGGEANQWAPALYQNTVPIEPPDDPDYHLTVDLTDRAINWIRQQKALTPDKP